MELSETLTRLRNSANLTQQEVADMLNIKRSAYATYETGRNEIGIGLLQKISNYYSVSIDEIVNGTAEIKKADLNFKSISRKEITFIKASLKILTEIIVKSEARFSKLPVLKVSLDVQKKIEKEIERLVNEGD